MVDFSEFCKLKTIDNRNMKIRFMLAAISVVILCACSGSNGTDKFTRTVRTLRPEIMADTNGKIFSGIVAESHEVSLGFKTAGQIDRIYVKEGDFVPKGTLLATLDASDYIIGADGLRAQTSQLKAEYERCQKLYEQKSMSLNDFEKIRAGYAQAQSQLKGVENKIAYTRLYAPVSGHIQSVNFSKAEMVDAGTPIFNLLDDTSMVLSVDIPANIYRQMRNIEEIIGTIPGNEAKMPLQIMSIVPKADGNQLYRMKLSIPSKYNKYLTPGLNVDVEIKTAGNDIALGNLRIPAHSIVRENDCAYVWVVKPDSTLSKREVTIGGFDGTGFVSITSGIDVGEEIVCSGVNMLKDGEKVKILEKPSKTNVGELL